jgi:hypothetical protein
MSSHKLDVQRRTICFARLTLRRDRELRFELQVRAVGGLERHFDSSGSPLIAGDRAGDTHRVAVGRVQREVRPVDVDTDVA